MQLMNTFSNQQSSNVLAEEALDFIIESDNYEEYQTQLNELENLRCLIKMLC